MRLPNDHTEEASPLPSPLHTKKLIFVSPGARTDAPSWVRVLFAAAVGVLLGTLVTWVHATSGRPSDWEQVYWGARALWQGLDPYTAVGPGSDFYDYPWPLFYPVSALVLALPFAIFPLGVAQTLWVGACAALLVYAVDRKGPHWTPIFVSGAFVMGVLAAQWSPLLVASVLLPGLAWAALAKPTIGAALLLSMPGSRHLRCAIRGALPLLAVSFLLRPDWPLRWLSTVQQASHFTPPVLLWGGPLILLGLLRWRRWEARMLIALACVPQTTLAYESLYVLLVARNRRETLLLAILSLAALLLQAWLDVRLPLSMPLDARQTAFRTHVENAGMLSLALVYLPALLMVLRRPNEGELPGWITWLADRARRFWAVPSRVQSSSG